MFASDLKNLQETYQNLYEEKNDSHSQPNMNMNKRESNNKKAVEDMKKMPGYKSMVATAAKKFDEEVDAFDLVLEYLLSEGHVDTVEEAHYVMMEMDAETISEIAHGTGKKVMPSAKERSALAKKARLGQDIGKPGKGFEKVAAKAAKQYGSKEAGERVAAAAMFKAQAKKG